MTHRLILVDLENVQKIDLSVLDDSYRAILFVGASQNPPKAASKPSTAHRFRRVEFHKISGTGKNALDFHIAFHLGRMFETDTDTHYIVVSGDKGFDPLLTYLNANGLKCERVDSFAELAMRDADLSGRSAEALSPTVVVCPRCQSTKNIELHGGRWCSNCGSYASPPDPAQLPSNRNGYREPERTPRMSESRLICAWCNQPQDMSDGIYDDGEWMCGACIAEYAR